MYFKFFKLNLLYSQFSLYFQDLPSFCIFRLYCSSILWSFLFFLNSQFFTYIFVYFQVSYIFHIIRFYHLFYILYFLYFYAFHMFYISLLLPIGFLPRKCFIYPFVLQNQQKCFSYQWHWAIDDFCGEVWMDEYFMTLSLWGCNTFCTFKWSLKIDAKCKMVTFA